MRVGSARRKLAAALRRTNSLTVSCLVQAFPSSSMIRERYVRLLQRQLFQSVALFARSFLDNVNDELKSIGHRVGGADKQRGSVALTEEH